MLFLMLFCMHTRTNEHTLVHVEQHKDLSKNLWDRMHVSHICLLNLSCSLKPGHVGSRVMSPAQSSTCDTRINSTQFGAFRIRNLLLHVKKIWCRIICVSE